MKTLFVFALTLFTAVTSLAQASGIQNVQLHMTCENKEWRVTAKFVQDFLVNAKNEVQLRSFNVTLSIPNYEAEAKNDQLEAEGHRIPEAVFVDERPALYGASCSGYTKTLIGCNVMEKNSTTSGYKIRLKTTGEPQEEGKEEIPTGEIVAWHSNGETEPIALTCGASEMVEVQEPVVATP